MITIKNSQTERKEFKKLFKNHGDVCLKLIPYNNEKVDIVITGHHNNITTSYKIEAVMGYNALKKNITLSFIDPMDCVFDVIFSKDGFYVDTYENAYSELITKSKSGSEGYLSQVIFKSKDKKRDFIAPCNEYVKMIS